MSKQGFAAIHHPMSVEDPETGFPPSVDMVSEDKQAVIDHVQKEMEDAEYAETDMVEVGDEIHFLANFEEGDEMMTYWVIEPTTIA